jgi:thiol-disulfide isomerase/thioredoxin
MRRPLSIIAHTILAIFGTFALQTTAESAQIAPPSTALFGRVLDSSGNPVAGATVALHSFNRVFSGRPGQWGETASRITMDDEGRFQFSEADGFSFADAYERMWMVVARHVDFASACRKTTVEEGQQVTLDLVLTQPASLSIQVRDETGRAVRGASLRGVHSVAESGGFNLRRDDLPKLGLHLNGSDEAGCLKLPQLPDGATVDVVIEHPDLAPTNVRDVVRSGTVVPVTMRRGVRVTLAVAPSREEERIEHVTVYMRQERTAFGHPSMMWFQRLEVSEDGTATFTAEASSYSVLHLYHEDFYLINEDPAAKGTIRLDGGREHVFSFQLHRKAKARGRVVDAVTGKPIEKFVVDGEILGRSANGKDNSKAVDWSYVADAVTDGMGIYTITLAPGPARVSGTGRGYTADGGPVGLVVAADGTAVFPDLKLRRLRKITGTVYNPGGKPLAGAIVRLRGDMRYGVAPSVTDADGRFEVIVPFLRYHPDTNEPLVIQPLVAFHPFKPLSAKVEVRLDDPDTITGIKLVLEPHPCETLLTDFMGEMSDWEKGVIPAERAAELAAQSLKGKPAPEVDGAVWLNAPRESMRLADFRGKYVLLDFWATTCGPCHVDFPTLKLLHDLYSERGFTVIGIHDNSVAPKAVHDHVKEQGLTFPVVIDAPDGRILNRYKPHGVQGFPSYLLIGPDGKVLHQKGVLPEPSLQEYMLEIVRNYLIK